MFPSVLIANRGEIACRIARTAKRLGIRTIAVYSDADAQALHVALCDEAYRIGLPPARDSYLSIERILAVAERAGAAAIHPGYGFLAENADFAEAVAAAGMVFVGPPPAAIRAMGLKDAAKATMERAGVPVVPGYHGARQDPGFLEAKAVEIGYPVLIKPIAGGGGKGMRRVDHAADFADALAAAQREAAGAFGDARVLLERFVPSPRHIEVQVFADRHGGVLHLHERDCSLQRRHQKIIEEAPAPGMRAELRAALGQAAIAAARAVGYEGAGTVEFIADGRDGLKPDGFWFMEMNTRLQVEHPVTEAVTGLDLVEWQFRVANGEALPVEQDAIPLRGHAVEARVYAEDPERGFVPSTGRLAAVEWPSGPGIRVDAGVQSGGTVSPFYDPMLAKIIAHGTTREEALDRLAAALASTLIVGPRTNAAFLRALCGAPDFREGRFDTGFIDRHLEALTAVPEGWRGLAARAAVTRLLAREQARVAASAAEAGSPAASPWNVADGFTLGGQHPVVLPMLIDGRRVVAEVGLRPGRAFEVSFPDEDLHPEGQADLRLLDIGARVVAAGQGRQLSATIDEGGQAVDDESGDGAVLAPMHGKVLGVFVENGALVEKGTRLAVIEAMKMEHTLTAAIGGTVADLTIRAGEQVAEGARLLTIVPGAAEPSE